jgi:hypothetical protein
VFIEKARQDKMATHNASKKHLYCLALSQRDSEKARNISAARLNVSITSKFDSLCKLIVTVYTVARECMPFQKVPSLLLMQVANGVPLLKGYDNHIFWDSIIELTAEVLRDKQDERIAQSPGISIAGDGSATRSKIETEVQHVKYFSKKEKKVVTEYFGLLAIDRSKVRMGRAVMPKPRSQHTKN